MANARNEKKHIDKRTTTFSTNNYTIRYSLQNTPNE